MNIDLNILYAKILPFILPLVFIISGFILGKFTDKVIFRRLRRLAENTPWKGDDIIMDSIQGKAVFLLLIAGLFGAVYNLPLKENIQQIIFKSLTVILILIFTLILSRIISGFLSLYNKNGNGVFPASSIISNITRLLIILLGFLIILNFLGIPITPLLTALGVGGLAVALALQDTLSNLFSGIYIISSKQIKLNDYVKLESGEEGFVSDITWRNTIIKTMYNNIIVIPNSKLASTIITNYNLDSSEMKVLIPVGVSYDSDLEKVEKVTLDAARETIKEEPGCDKNFEPLVRYHTFDDFSINFNVILQVREFTEQYPVKHQFIKRLHRRYKEENIEIPFPIRTLHIKEKK